MKSEDRLASVPGVCRVRIVSAPGADPDIPPALLFELPHGATTEADYRALRGRLRSELPEDLKDFFFVNTDAGSPEYAREAARQLTTPPASTPRLEELLGPEIVTEAGRLSNRKILIVRCLIPRTFIDCNRVLDADPAEPPVEGITAAVPEYVTAEADVELLHEMYLSYQAVAGLAYDRVCGAGGTALQLHTYAPRSVRVDRLDGCIVETLRRAYAPEIYESWEARPDVDLITEDAGGTLLAPPRVVASLKAYYAAIGIRATENETYRLHPATMGRRHSVRHPGQVLCLEINRACLADPFSPFEEMRIGGDKTARMSAPVAAACLEELVRKRGGR